MSKKKKSNAYDIKKWLKHKKWTKNLSCSPNKEVIFDGVDDFAPMPSTYVSLQDLKKWLGYIFSDEHMDMVRGDHEAMDERRADVYRKIRDADSQWSNNQSKEIIYEATKRLEELGRFALFGEYLPASAHYSFVPEITIPEGCTSMTIETPTITLNRMEKPEKFKKKPVVIEAMEVPSIFNVEAKTTMDKWLSEAPARWSGNDIFINTLEGEMRASPGDWIIKGVKGEFYPCRADIFAMTYEPAAEKQPTPDRNLNFGQAIEALKRGQKVAREGWNGKGMFLFLLPAGSVPRTFVHDPMLKRVLEGQNINSFEALGTIRMLTADKKILTGWLASQTDMLAEDWMIIKYNDAQ